MKKLLCICMIMMSCISAFGQASVSNVAIPEPEFNGDAFICNLSANTYVKAEKTIGQMKTKDQFWGPERKLYVKPSKSSVRVKKGHIQFVIRVPNINDDPYSFIKISKFATGSTRKISLARQNELSGKVTYGGKNKQELFFEAKKYGASSLLIDADIEKPGEYCIMISNPNRVDGKIPVSCFGVDE